MASRADGFARKSSGCAPFRWFGLCALTVACSVDDRILSGDPDASTSGGTTFDVLQGGTVNSGEADAGSFGGSTGGQAPRGGSGGNAGSAGSTGSSGAPPPGAGGSITSLPVEGLDGGADGDGPCDGLRTAVSVLNSAFDDDTDGWPSDAEALSGWSPEDARDESDSGALSVTNQLVVEGEGTVMLGASQCVSIESNTAYRVCVDYYVDPRPEDRGPVATTNEAAAVALSLFDGADCRGSTSQNPTPLLHATRGGWVSVEVELDAPPRSQVFQSMLVRLVSVKRRGAEPLQVLFDNVKIAALPD
jgi:hypothetical protein